MASKRKRDFDIKYQSDCEMDEDEEQEPHYVIEERRHLELERKNTEISGPEGRAHCLWVELQKAYKKRNQSSDHFAKYLTAKAEVTKAVDALTRQQETRYRKYNVDWEANNEDASIKSSRF